MQTQPLIVHRRKNSHLFPLVIALTLSLGACGGGGGSSSSTASAVEQQPDTAGGGMLELGVTDAPVDDAIAVVVEFEGVTVKPVEGEPIEIVYESPMAIDLLALQGSESELLLDGEELPAGDYAWVRLDVNAERMTVDSYVDLESGERISLFVPSGSQSGLRLVRGFSIPEGGTASFTIDFDLRKSITAPKGQEDYFLKPALRLIDNNDNGSITGTVDDALLSADNCTSSNAVYIYEGFDVTPDDVDGNEPDPVTSAFVEQDPESGDFVFEAGFIEPGDYTVAFTCQANDDDPEADDEIAFATQGNVTISTSETKSLELIGGQEGSISLGVTDAPVDEAEAVVVEFTGVSIKPKQGDIIEFEFDEPRIIDLLALQGSDSELLLADEPLEAGEYAWIRLGVNAERGVEDSYIEFEGQDRHSLFIPSGNANGLRLVRGFSIPSGGSASFTIDFDLRKSITNPVGQDDFFLRPALRIIDNNEMGHLAGSIEADLAEDSNCTSGNAVYVFEGADVTPDDIDEADPEPVSTAIVSLDEDSGEYVFTLGFLEAGEYTLSFTCQAEDDDVQTDDNIDFPAAINVTVVSGETAGDIVISGDG